MADDISAWQQFFEFSDFSCQFTVKFKKRHLRSMLVREMRTMPERGDPEDEF